MPPFVTSFPAQEVPLHSLTNERGYRRKGFDGDLKACELLELLQYSCFVEEPVSKESVTRCRPVERLFRRCKDDKGSFVVETTAWEDRKSG